MESKLTRARAIALAVACCAATAVFAQAAQAATAHGALLRVAKPRTATHATQSSNWFGYNQGALEQGGKTFHSITGDWVVPKATQHTKGQDEFSSDWIGIGGGCVDANCLVTDNTLIQTGTEQDVDSSGKASYSAWWEIIPAPSITVSLPVHPGDHMHASISETVPEVWNITLRNVTRGKTFSTTVPYTSSYATAEWIEETPLVFGTGGVGLAALPNLSKVPFTNATTNGANANLKASEEIQLVDSNGKVIGTPSAPNRTHNGFDDCAWASTCS